MKSFLLQFALAGFFVLPSLTLVAPAAEVADTKAQVIAEHGEPLSRRYMGNEREVWQYPRGQVTFMAGRVSEAVMASDPFVPSIPNGPPIAGQGQPAPPAAELPIAPTFDKAEHEAGMKLAKDLRTSVDFLVASPERQREILRSFKQRYPHINISDLEQSVARAPAQALAPRVAEQGRRAAELERRAADAERKAADAHVRLNQEIERRRQAEREAALDRERNRNRFNVGPVVTYPSYSYPQRVYVPQYTFEQRSCDTYGFVPFRTIPQRSYRGGSRLGGSLAFRGGSY